MPRTLIPNRLPGAILTVNEMRNLYSINRNLRAAERQAVNLTRRLNTLRGQVQGSTYNRFQQIRQEMGQTGLALEEVQEAVQNLRQRRANLNARLEGKYTGGNVNRTLALPNGTIVPYRQMLPNGTLLRYTRANKAAEIARFENWARRHARHLLIEKLRKPARAAAAMSLLTLSNNGTHLPNTAVAALLPYRSIHGNYRSGTTRRRAPAIHRVTRRN